jgi:aminomethyltransferase
MNLYGQDMDDAVHPLEAGMGWTIAWDHDFIGKAALLPLKGQSPKKQVGLLLEGRGVMRAHMPVRFANGAVGETTSGGFSPTLKQSIAFARIDSHADGACEVEIRGQWLPAKIVKMPFVRNGQALI